MNQIDEEQINNNLNMLNNLLLQLLHAQIDGQPQPTVAFRLIKKLIQYQIINAILSALRLYFICLAFNDLSIQTDYRHIYNANYFFFAQQILNMFLLMWIVGFFYFQEYRENARKYETGSPTNFKLTNIDYTNVVTLEEAFTNRFIVQNIMARFYFIYSAGLGVVAIMYLGDVVSDNAKSPNNFLGFVYIFAILALTIFIIMVIQVIYEYCIWKKDQGKDQKTIISLQKAQELEVPDCLICLVAFTTQEHIAQLSCYQSHIYHDECILAWFKTHLNCPICQKDFNENIVQKKKFYQQAFKLYDIFSFVIK